MEKKEEDERKAKEHRERSNRIIAEAKSARKSDVLNHGKRVFNTARASNHLNSAAQDAAENRDATEERQRMEEAKMKTKEAQKKEEILDEKLAMMMRMQEQLDAQAAAMEAKFLAQEEKQEALRKAQEEKQRELLIQNAALAAQLEAAQRSGVNDESSAAASATEQNDDVASLPGVAWALGRLRMRLDKQRERTQRVAIAPVIAMEDEDDNAAEEEARVAYNAQKEVAEKLRAVRMANGADSEEYRAAVKAEGRSEPGVVVPVSDSEGEEEAREEEEGLAGEEAPAEEEADEKRAEQEGQQEKEDASEKPEVAEEEAPAED